MDAHFGGEFNLRCRARINEIADQDNVSIGIGDHYLSDVHWIEIGRQWHIVQCDAKLAALPTIAAIAFAVIVVAVVAFAIAVAAAADDELAEVDR